ncbi:hypothetical protein V8E36_003195 [Tilletia maclaganii]
MTDPLEDLVLNRGADARRTAAELPGIQHSRRGPQDDKPDDEARYREQGGGADDGDDGRAPALVQDADRMPRTGAGEGHNTGPKGVIRDQRERAAANAHLQAERIRATNEALRKMALTANTAEDEERIRKREARNAEKASHDRERRRSGSDSDHSAEDGDEKTTSADRVDPAAAAEFAARERRRAQRLEELQREAERRRVSVMGVDAGTLTLPPSAQRTDAWFGHLREVDATGYVRATDDERPDVPVVVHIYEKSVPACRILTASLTSLARQYPHTKFVQVRALSVGFGLTDDEIGAEEEAEDDEDEAHFLARQELLLGKVEPVLPTLHIYFGGELRANLVRVDLDDNWHGGKETAVRDILSHHRAILEVRNQPRNFSKQLGPQPPDSDSDYDL